MLTTEKVNHSIVTAPIPPNEEARLAALARYNLLDTEAEAVFDRITRLAARLLKLPVALISLIDRDRQWAKSCYGVEFRESPRALAFCAHVIVTDHVMVVPDATQDERFVDNPLVTGPLHVRFYAGAPLRTPDGFNIGSLCVLDSVPREFSEEDVATLTDLAAMVIDEIELRVAASRIREESAGRQNVQNALQRSEAKFRSLIENAQDIITILEADGTIRYESPSLEHVLGYQPEDMLGRNVFKFIHPDDVVPMIAVFQELLNDEPIPAIVQFRFLHKDGSWHILEATATNLINDPLVGGVVVNSRDVSEREHISIALQKSSARFRAAIEGGFDLFYLLQAVRDEQGQIDDFTFVDINTRGAQLINRTREETIGQKLSDLVPSMRRDGFWAKYRQVVETGQALEEEFPVKWPEVNAAWLHHQVIPVEDGVAITTRDITQRKIAEAALRESEDRFKSAFAVSAIGMALVAPNGHWLQVNPVLCNIVGYSEAELLEGSFQDITHPDDLETDLHLLNQVLDGELSSYEIEKRYIHKRGHTLWALLSVALVRDALGEPLYFVSQVQDITARKHTEERRAMRHAITQILAEASSLDVAAPRVLQTLVEGFQWQAGSLWRVEARDKSVKDTTEKPIMRCLATWYQSGQVASDWESITRNAVFERGDGLPGRVWESPQPVWVTDFVGESVFPRAKAAQEEQFNNAFAFPILISGEVLGIVEFFAKSIEQPDDELLEMASTIGSQLGQFMERVRVGSAVRASETHLKSIIESAMDAIVAMDPEGKVVGWNPAAERIFGYRYDEVMGEDLAELIIPPAFRAAHRMGIQKYLETGQGVVLDNRLELPAQRADGSELQVELVVTPTPSAESPIFTGFLRDITEQKRSRQLLDESEQRYKSLFEYNTDGIVSLDLDGRFISTNPAMEQISGYTAEELHQKYLMKFIAAEDRERVGNHFVWAQEGAPQSLEFGLLHKDGHRVDVMATGLPIIVDKAIVGVYAMVHDITARKRNEELIHQAKNEAEEANRAKSEFLSRMSHELRTPLNAILGFGQLLEMDALEKGQEESVEQIMKAGRHLLELINEVLDISRIETGRLAISPEPVSLEEVIVEAASLVRPLADQRQVVIEGISSCAYWVQSDRQRLRQVLLNLFSNAVKYNNIGGRVFYHCEETSNGRLLVHIRDTGRGIAADKMKRLFSPFERLGAENSDIEGTGLGLALSKRLIEAMGGTIEAESIEGQGTTFLLRLPIAISPLDTLEKSLGEAPALQNTDTTITHSVLYIEDNGPNLRLVERVLAHRPQVRLFATVHGYTGLELARAHKPDLILLDLHLPDISGIEVFQQLQEDSLTRDIPVVIVSADGTPRQIERLRAAGVYRYLTKPIDVQQLLQTLDEIFDKTPE